MDETKETMSLVAHQDAAPWQMSTFNYIAGQGTFVLRSTGKLVSLYVRDENLADWPRKDDFIRLANDAMRNYDAERAVIGMVTAVCVEIMRNDSSHPFDPKDYTVQQYFAPGKLYYNIIGSANGIRAVPCTKDTKESEPSYSIMQIHDILKPSDLTFIEASDLVVCPERESDAEWLFCSQPRKVYNTATGIHYHFKARRDHDSMQREFSILEIIKEKGFDRQYRLPTIEGFVHFQGDLEHMLGTLTNYIDNVGTLASVIHGIIEATREQKQKWMKDITKMVQALHQDELIWGDVKPENIVIDTNMEAWVVDFGGGYNSEFVDEDVMETVAGDLQGLSRLKKALLGGEEVKEDKSNDA